MICQCGIFAPVPLFGPPNPFTVKYSHASSDSTILKSNSNNSATLSPADRAVGSKVISKLRNLDHLAGFLAHNTLIKPHIYDLIGWEHALKTNSDTQEHCSNVENSLVTDTLQALLFHLRTCLSQDN